MDVVEIHKRMKEECTEKKCKNCPYFLVVDDKPTCTHDSNYILDCKIVNTLIYPNWIQDE